MLARTKRASVAEDGTPINRRVPMIFATESSSSEEETETESNTGAQEDTIRMNRNPNRKGKGVAEEETEALKPTNFFFPTTQYNKSIKIETRCSLLKTIETLKRVLMEKELGWFHDHPQFKHFFHMPELKNHKSMGMWMLLLRTVCTSKIREAWFLVNGTPIRYSIREHGIISGLFCHNYPLNWGMMGGTAFIERHFQMGSTIRLADVERKFKGMRNCKDRLNMAVFYFLSSVIVGKKKTGAEAPSVESFFLRAVNDLELCKTFPWGRLSFYDNLCHINQIRAKFGGVVDKEQWCFPSFLIPLELLAFEIIPALKAEFLKDPKQPANPSCPRMCKSQFKCSPMKGIPLDEIYEKLGKTEDIDSILVTTHRERRLLAAIFDAEEDRRDTDCPMVDSWMKQLLKDEKPVFWKELLELDCAGRSQPLKPKKTEVEGVGQDEIKKVLLSIQEGMVKMNQTMEKGFEIVQSTFSGYETRLKAVETFVEAQGFDFAGDDYNDYNPPSRFFDVGGSSRGEKTTEAKETEKEPEETEKETEKEAEKEVQKEAEMTENEAEKEAEEKEAGEKEKEAEEKETEEKEAEEKETEKNETEEKEAKKKEAKEKETEAEEEKETEAEEEKETEAAEDPAKRIKRPAAALRTPYQAGNQRKRKTKNPTPKNPAPSN